MYLSIFITICLVVGAITFHYWVLGLLLGVVPNPETDHSHFLRSLSLLLMIVFSHVLEIVAFALGYLAGVRYLGWSMPGFGGDQILSFFDAFYHSATTYSTLGLSKVPSGEAGFMTAWNR